MLQSIREKTSGWIAYVIIGLISIPFALWGINSYLGGGQEQPAAVVDGVEISPRQLDQSYARYRDRLRQVFGGTLPAAFDNEAMLKEQVLNQIIEEQVLLSYIDDHGYRVGDEKLFEAIRAMSVFQQDGKFDKDLYRNQLASQGYQPAQFEQELRRSSAMSQINQAIKSTAFVVPSQLERFDNLGNQARKIRLLTVENNVETVTVSDEEISDFYNDQAQRYMTPERVKVDYIEVSLAKVKRNISVDEAQVRERYEQMKDHLTSAEVRDASHILIRVAEEASDDESDQALKTLEGLKIRANQGEDFAELAKQFSQDPGSAADGGSLGEVERGIMVKPFEDALFAMQANSISEPVKTQFGWHLIKLNAISGGETQSFEQAHDRLADEIKTELAETRIYDLVENLSNIGYEQPDSLLPAAESLDLKIETTDWFTRAQGTGLAGEEKFRAAAFSDDVLNRNHNSETIELAPNQVVIMHLNQHEPSKQPPLEDVKDRVVQALKIKRGREIAKSMGEAIFKSVKQGQSLDDAAAEAGLKVFDADFIKRSSTDVDGEVVRKAFVMPKPEGKPVLDAVAEIDGDYSIIELSEVKSASDAAESAQAQEKLITADANYGFQAVVKTLTEQSDVVKTPIAELMQ